MRWATSISRVAQQVGGSVGTAVLIVILQRTSAGDHTPADLAFGFGDAFWWAAAFTAAADLLCLLLPGRPVPEPQVQAVTSAEQSAEVWTGHSESRKWCYACSVWSPVGEALDGGAQPGPEFGGVAEFGSQDAAAGGGAEHEGVDRCGPVVRGRVVQAALAQVAV